MTGHPSSYPNIVERLRAIMRDRFYEMPRVSRACEDAANEIERLEAQLAKSCDDGRFQDVDAGCDRAVAAETEVKRLLGVAQGSGDCGKDIARQEAKKIDDMWKRWRSDSDAQAAGACDEIVGTIVLGHSNKIPGHEDKKKQCICCPGFDSHIYTESLDLPDYVSSFPQHFGKSVDYWIKSTFNFKANEGRKIKVTIEMLPASALMSTDRVRPDGLTEDEKTARATALADARDRARRDGGTT